MRCFIGLLQRITFGFDGEVNLVFLIKMFWTKSGKMNWRDKGAPVPGEVSSRVTSGYLRVTTVHH